MFAYAVCLLVRLLLALVATLGHTATTAPAPVHHTAPAAPVHHHRPPARTATTPAQARALVARLVAQHHGHVAQWGSYGYGPQGQHTARNGGVWAQVGPGRCVGYETYGAPGFFGNVYGLASGDCS